ncbi:MAG: sugar phosphate isomerase/epimerase [Isosphaeraceae bacterium]
MGDGIRFLSRRCQHFCPRSGRFGRGNSAFSQQISTFYGPSVQSIDTQLNALATLSVLARTVSGCLNSAFLGLVHTGPGSGLHHSRWARSLSLVAGCEDQATVVADVFHMIRGGGSIDDLLQLPGGRLANFHINDVPADPDPLTQTDYDRVMVGDGIADLPKVIANLRSIGYHGPLSLERFNRDLWECDPETVAKRGLERVRSLVEA